MDRDRVVGLLIDSMGGVCVRSWSGWLESVGLSRFLEVRVIPINLGIHLLLELFPPFFYKVSKLEHLRRALLEVLFIVFSTL